MPTMTARVSVPAAGKIDNVLAGKTYEFLPFDAVAEFGLVASAPGLMATVISGSDVLQDDQEISSANRMPIYPDDFILNDVVAEGERLVVSLRNTTAAAITAYVVVKITPL